MYYVVNRKTVTLKILSYVDGIKVLNAIIVAEFRLCILNKFIELGLVGWMLKVQYNKIDFSC